MNKKLSSLKELISKRRSLLNEEGSVEETSMVVIEEKVVEPVVEEPTKVEDKVVEHTKETMVAPVEETQPEAPVETTPATPIHEHHVEEIVETSKDSEELVDIKSTSKKKNRKKYN